MPADTPLPGSRLSGSPVNSNPRNGSPVPLPDDGTRQLLQGGGWMVGSGLLATALLETVLGGFTRTGAHTNAGWFALIVALMCLPFGGLLFALGVAKWLGHRRAARSR